MRLPDNMSLDEVVASLGPSHKVQPMLVESQAQAAPTNLSAPCGHPAVCVALRKRQQLSTRGATAMLGRTKWARSDARQAR